MKSARTSKSNRRGAFTTAGGVAANYIAKRDGSSRSALGSGMDSAGSALAVSGPGSDLYAEGLFMLGGGKASPFALAVSPWSSARGPVDR